MEILPLFAVAFGIIGFAGGAVGYFAKGRADAIIKAQAELIDTRDKQIADRDAKLAASESKVTLLTEQNKTLTGLAQGSPQLEALTREMKRLPKEITKLILKAMKEAKK